MLRMGLFHTHCKLVTILPFGQYLRHSPLMLMLANFKHKEMAYTHLEVLHGMKAFVAWVGGHKVWGVLFTQQPMAAALQYQLAAAVSAVDINWFAAAWQKCCRWSHATLEIRMGALGASITALAAAIEAQQTALVAAIEAQGAELEASIGRQREDLVQRMATQGAVLEGSIARLREDLVQRVATVEAAVDEVATVETTVDEVAAQQTTLESSMAEQRSELEASITELEALVDRLREDLEQRMAELEAASNDAPSSRLLIVPLNQTERP